MNKHQSDMLQEERENMKSLCLGITGEVARLISNQGINRDLRVLELTVFGMFVVIQTFMAARRDQEETNSQITDFHREMMDYVTNEYFIKLPSIIDRKILESADAADVVSQVQKFHDEFISRSTSRYHEYEHSLELDLENPVTIFSEISGSVIANIFIEQLSIEERNYLLVPLGLKLAELYLGCLESFKI